MSDWALKITRADNGYILTWDEETETESPIGGFETLHQTQVIEDNDEDELSSGEKLLWHVMDFFSFGGSKHDPIRLRVVRMNQGGDIIAETEEEDVEYGGVGDSEKELDDARLRFYRDDGSETGVSMGDFGVGPRHTISIPGDSK